jgi:hypothetical protein
MATCKSCGAAIVWCVMDSGRRMPLDSKAETLVAVDLHGENLVGHVVRAHRSHFSTCPHASEHRKERDK